MGRLLGIKKEKCMSKNIAKVVRYFKKNGIMNTIYAVMERVFFAYYKNYEYKEPDKAILDMQRKKVFKENILFSIVVPAYETNEIHLKEMLDSVQNQTYGKWELILADASSSTRVSDVVKEYDDERIIYRKLAKNEGISQNTNEGIKMAKGDYIALLDHDDLLTPDALYEMASKIEEEKNAGKIAKMIFSDEDKCNGDASRFFSPHYKMEYNKELLFTNNYICHLLVAKAEIMKKLLLRKEFDGAQDYDLVLRMTSDINKEQEEGQAFSICHIGKILYHWRCHENSTAENPESKMYAYEAGRRAVKTQFEQMGRTTKVVHSRHLGFYEPKIENMTQLFLENEKLGCIGGAVYYRNKVIGGAMDCQGKVLYAGLHKRFEGYMNRAHLMQSAYAVDIRNIVVREEFKEILDEMKHRVKDKKDADYVALSLEFCEKIRNLGYEIMYWEP